MINYDGLRETVVKGLKEYLKIPVIRSNQNEPPPKYPYISYTVTTPLSNNNGTWGVYDDGIDRKPTTQTWSINALSDDDTESVNYAMKAREWLDNVGTTYLKDNGVNVQSVGSITPRDNVITIDYEYKKGFDVVFWLFDEIDKSNIDTIEDITINNAEYTREPTAEELADKLSLRLTGR